ncbi:MAG: hypothetical protein LUI13_14960 [Lachnospiraceae bacterium]|nr:hypothetical protein [Lachnospiraceae bacterium]
MDGDEFAVLTKSRPDLLWYRKEPKTLSILEIAGPFKLQPENTPPPAEQVSQMLCGKHQKKAPHT